MKWIIKKIILFIINFFRNDLRIDILSNISPNLYKKFKGSNKHKIIISNSTLDGDISVEYGCKINNATCLGNIKLGRFVSINGSGTRVFSGVNGIEIGSFSSVGPNVVIQEIYHRMDKISTYHVNFNLFNSDLKKDIYSKGKIIIEEDVWIGANSVVLSGVKVGRGSIIGAGSIVTKDIPRYSVVAGNPARIIKYRFSDSIIEKLEESKWWELSVEEIIKNKDVFNRSLLNEDLSDVFFH